MSTDPLQSIRDTRATLATELAETQHAIADNLTDLATLRQQRDELLDQVAACDRALAPKRTRRTKADPATGTLVPTEPVEELDEGRRPPPDLPTEPDEELDD